MNKMILAKYSANDTNFTILSWVVDNKHYVEKGQVILTLETSKVTIELESDYSGYILKHCVEGEELSPGAVLASFYHNRSELPPDEHINQYSASTSNATSQSYQVPGTRFSTKALQFIKQNQIDQAAFKDMGLVNETIVKRYFQQQQANFLDHRIFPQSNSVKPSPAKKAEIATLSRADANQYSSSLNIKISSKPLRE